MKRNYFINTIFFLITLITFSQKSVTEKYENGNIKFEGYLKGNTLDSIYKEYYENGNIKEEGLYKNCQYKTNRKSIFISGCGTGNSDTIKLGKKHGTWKQYFINGNLQSISNFHCDLMQGNFYTYFENGNIESVEFYTEGKIINSQEYNENGIVENSTFYKYHSEKGITNDDSFEYIYDETGKLQTITTNIENENGEETETIIEYYKNGFLKSESITFENRKNGIQTEYYENGNMKFEGLFKDGEPTKKHYFYSENGKLSKIEHWKKNKIIKTEIK